MATLMEPSPAPSSDLHHQAMQQNMNGGGNAKSISSLTNSIHHNNNNHLASSSPYLCTGCGRPIVDQYLLKALDCYWHEDCLKCGCCDCRLGEVGSTLYTKANLILCKRDYLRMFGTSGNCAACSKSIPAFEMVMRAKNNVYHLDCFACQQCHQRFCVGDRFYLCENRILCEYDYEERMVMSHMPSAGNHLASTNGGAQHIQRRVTDIHQQQQSGSGSLNPPISPPFFASSGQFQLRPSHPKGFADPSEPQAALRTLVGQFQHQQHQFQLANRQHQLPYQLIGQQLKHGSPSDGSSSGYGSPDSVQLEDR